MTYFELTKVLGKISRALVGVFSVTDLEECILDLCQDIFEAEACSLFLFDEKYQELRMVAARGYSAKFMDYPKPIFESSQRVVEKPTSASEKVGVTGWIAVTGRAFMSNSFDELQSHPHWRGVHDKEQLGRGKSVHSFYGVPLRVADEKVIGVLKVENKRLKGKYQPFTDDDAHIFDILAAHVAIAIANARLVDDIQERRAQLQTITDALQQVVGSLSEELPMQHLLDEIVETTATVLSAEACVLFLKDEGRDVLIERAGVGYVAHLIGKAEYPLVPLKKLIEEPITDDEKVGLTAWIAITGKPFLARDNAKLKEHPHWRGRYDPEHYPDGSGRQCESFLGVPLLVADEVVGVLKVENKKVDNSYVPFDDQDRLVFETLARSIAIAVGKVREQRFKREQAVTDAMYRVSEALAGRFELEPLLEEIVKIGKEIFNAEACVVFLVDPTDPDRLVETKGEGYVSHLEGIAEYHLIPRKDLIERPARPEDRVGLTAWIAITGQSFLARNNAELKVHPHWRGRYDSEHYREGSGKQCNSFLGLPLRVGDEILGVLKVENKQDGSRHVPFDERDQQLFQLLANSAAIAIRNTRDFQELQEAQQLASIGRSAAAMAHRMRTPLQGILSSVELLKENLGEGRTQQNIDDISDIVVAIDQMDYAIERVRLAAKQLQPVLNLYPIEDLVRASFTGNRSFAKQFREQQISTRILGLENLEHRMIQCDKNLIEEAISNLVGNALEAVDNGGHIDVSLIETQDGLRIEVQDDGPGVDKNSLNLFEPFNTTKKEGLGLGLFIVRRNIEAHRGAVSYVEKEKGACFRIDLPQLRQKEE